MTCPDRKTAEKIWKEGIDYRQSLAYGFEEKDEYIFHTLGVAEAAEKIARRLQGMDSEKAYVFGLLHDYGRRIKESAENKFHGQEGYEQMLKLGYDEVAQICLTHTFSSKEFDNNRFVYPAAWMDWAKSKLAQVNYSDYDYLICFCDKLFEGFSMVKVEDRAEGIARRYHLSDEQRNILLEESLHLKQYFDDKLKTNVYNILGLEK